MSLKSRLFLSKLNSWPRSWIKEKKESVNLFLCQAYDFIREPCTMSRKSLHQINRYSLPARTHPSRKKTITCFYCLVFAKLTSYCAVMRVYQSLCPTLKGSDACIYQNVELSLFKWGIPNTSFPLCATWRRFTQFIWLESTVLMPQCASKTYLTLLATTLFGFSGIYFHGWFAKLPACSSALTSIARIPYSPGTNNQIFLHLPEQKGRAVGGGRGLLL